MTTLPTMDDALAAGDGCLHAVIDALEAQVAADKKYIRELDESDPELISLREQVSVLRQRSQTVLTHLQPQSMEQLIPIAAILSRRPDAMTPMKGPDAWRRLSQQAGRLVIWLIYRLGARWFLQTN